MSSTLYRKYRPTRWSDIAGQNHVKVTLAFEVASNKVAHAYLFSGPRGIGKTTTARILAKAVNCTTVTKDGEPCEECEPCMLITEGTTMDVIEIDAASHRGIDAVRENIIENARFSPSKLSRKVFIIDEVHMMTVEAFNALLKTLEEPPEGVMFILATTELHKVPATIVSRCQRFDFRRIPFADMVDRLRALCDDEQCKVDVKVLDEIARHSEGCLRDAEGLLGKVLSIGDGKRISYDQAIVVMPRSDYALAAQFIDALLRHETRIALQTVGDCIDQGVDLDRFADDVTELMRKVLLTVMTGNPDIFAADLDEDRKKALSDWAGIAKTPEVVHAIEMLMEAQGRMKHAKPPQLPLELAAVTVCERVAPSAVSAQPGAGASAPMRAAAPVAQPHADASTPASTPSVTATMATPVTATPPAPATATSVAQETATADEDIEAAVDAATTPTPVRKATSATQMPPKDALVASAAVPAGEPVLPMSRIREAWGELIKKTGEMSHSLNFLLSSAEPAEVVGDVLRIGFTFPFHRDKLNQDKVRTTVESACKGVFGCDMRVEGVLLEKSSGVGHSDAVAPAMAGSAPASSDAVSAPDAAADLAATFGGTVME